MTECVDGAFAFEIQALWDSELLRTRFEVWKFKITTVTVAF